MDVEGAQAIVAKICGNFARKFAQEVTEFTIEEAWIIPHIEEAKSSELVALSRDEKIWSDAAIAAFAHSMRDRQKALKMYSSLLNKRSEMLKGDNSDLTWTEQIAIWEERLIFNMLSVEEAVLEELEMELEAPNVSVNEADFLRTLEDAGAGLIQQNGVQALIARLNVIDGRVCSLGGYHLAEVAYNSFLMANPLVSGSAVSATYHVVNSVINTQSAGVRPPTVSAN